MATTLKDTVNDFGDKTTLHGIGYTLTKGLPLKQKVFWILVMIAVYTGFILVMVIYAIEYYKYDFVLTTKIINDDQQTIPAITLCNNNLFSRQAVMDQYPVLHTQIVAAYSGGTPDLSNLTEQHVQDAANVSFAEFAINTANRPHDLIVSCKTDVRETPHNCSLYTSQLLSEHGGVCYTLFSRDVTDKHDPIIKEQSGTKTALVLVLNLLTDDYYISTVGGEGLMLYIHSPDRTPYKDGKNVLIAPGTANNIGLKRVDIKRLPHPYTSGCDARPDYSQEQCLSNCTLDHFLKSSCYGGCTVWGDNPCSVTQVFSCIGQGEETTNCRCKPRCEETTYDVSVTSTKFPSRGHTVNMYDLNGYPTNDTELLARSYAEVYVYFETLDTQKMKQVPVLPFALVVSNLGGLIGLFCGASVVSIVELIELIIFLVHVVYQGRQRNIDMETKVHPVAIPQQRKPIRREKPVYYN